MRECRRCGKQEPLNGKWRTKVVEGERVLVCPLCRAELAEMKKKSEEYKRKRIAGWRRYRETNREYVKGKKKEYRNRTLEKKRAWRTWTQHMKKEGKSNPTVCDRCRMPGETDAHHYRGYEHPLDVLFLCRSCHRKAHTSAIPLPWDDVWQQIQERMFGN